MSDAERAQRSLQEARFLFVVTGAGISAASGIPTFRGEGGLWKGFRAEELATPGAFAADPGRVWEWYRWRRKICQDAQPNAAHGAIVALEKRSDNFLLATQNVDGLHPRAGSRSLIELHGCIDRVRCVRCDRVGDLKEDPANPPGALPRCALCDSLLRPHILWFGESYWPGIMERASEAAVAADVCLVVGTSGMVWPPISLALASQESGALLIDVNPNASQISEQADIWLQAPADEVLPMIL